MKILINAISAKLGGIVTYTTNLITALERRGVNFQVAVPTNFPDLPHTIRVKASHYPPLKRLLWEQTVWRHIVRRERPDVLFSSANFGLLLSPVPQLLMIREGGLFDPLYLSTIAPTLGLRNALFRQLRRRLMLVSAQNNDHIITPTSAMRDMFLAWQPDLADRCSVNPYGTLTDTFRPVERRPWRADGTLRLLYVSVYYPHKNPSDIVLACEQLVRDGLPTTLRLTMDLESIQTFAGSARDLFHVRRGVEQGLVQLGPVDYRQLPTAYATNDVFIFPSISETFGHPMVEAMASDIPIVAADTSVNREVLGEAALYYTPFRPSELASCLRQLDQDPALRATLVTAGRQRATAHFDWEQHVDRLMALFDQLTIQPR